MRREFVARARPSDVGHDIETTRRWVVDRLREAHEEELARPKRYDPPHRSWRMVGWFEERKSTFYKPLHRASSTVILLKHSTLNNTFFNCYTKEENTHQSSEQQPSGQSIDIPRCDSS